MLPGRRPCGRLPRHARRGDPARGSFSAHAPCPVPQVVDKVLEHLKKKHKGLEKVLKPNHVKSHLRLFINCLVENPAFDSQVEGGGKGPARTHAARIGGRGASLFGCVRRCAGVGTSSPAGACAPYPYRAHLPRASLCAALAHAGFGCFPPTPQTKENMTLKASAFGSKCVPSDKFFKEALSCGVLESILSFAQSKQSKDLKKTDGSKKVRAQRRRPGPEPAWLDTSPAAAERRRASPPPAPGAADGHPKVG